jgi:hypothetical protein
MNTHALEKEVKLNKLKNRLFNEGIRHYMIDKENTVTNRQIIKEFISGTLNISDAHTVNGWLDYLVSLGIFEHNPDSQKTRSGHIKPSNDTRYYVHFEKCYVPKIDHTHIVNSNRSSSENQANNKNKTLPLSNL